MIRHHAEPNINILSTRNLLFDSDVRQWSRPLMIPMHSLFAKSSNRKRDQFECDVIWFCFCFDFVCSQERYHLERGDAFEIGRPRSRGWKNFGRRWTGGGCLENWKIFKNVMCIIPIKVVNKNVLVGYTAVFGNIFYSKYVTLGLTYSS